MDWFIGHIVGDYLLQNDFMAMNKKESSMKGWLALHLHCALYTLAVCGFTGWWSLYAVLAVYLSHIVLDGTYLAVHYMRLIGSFKRIIQVPGHSDTLLAYICVDNTMHLLFLYLINKYLIL